MLGYELDPFLFSKKRFYKLEEILKETVLSRREFLKRFDIINEELLKRKRNPLELKKGVLAFPEDLSDFEEIRFNINPREFGLSYLERPYLLYLLVFSEFKKFDLSDLQELLSVSRNTVISDLKRLRLELGKRAIQLENSRKRGFYLEGEEFQVRQFAWSALQRLEMNSGYFVLSCFLNQDEALRIYKINTWLKELLSWLKLKQVQSRFLPVLFFTNLLLLREEKHQLTHPIGNLIQNIQIEKFKGKAGENDYFLALLIGSSDGEFKHPGLDFLYRLAFQIMENMMKLAAINFEDFTKTFLALLEHLIPTYFRLIYHFEVENPLLERIKREYSSLFGLVDRALEPLADITGKIPESELAYFVILFGGEIYKREYVQNLRGLVVCVNGISSSLIMKKRLEGLFPSMNFELTSSLTEFKTIAPSSYDLIFSTVPIESSHKKLYLMSPLPSSEEEIILYNEVLQDFQISEFVKPSAQAIYRAIEPYVTLKDEITQEKLLIAIDKKLRNKSLEREITGPMLSDLINKETIHFTDEALTWEEAIQRAAEPLLEKGIIEKTYPEAIIRRVKEFGPYIDLGSGICLPHARPEDGVNQIGMNFLRCEKPVFLVDDPKHEIKIFIFLAAVDNESHLRALSELTQILGNKESLNRLLAATNTADVENILTSKERSR